MTGLAFEIHNQLGRFFEESIYQGELARRCRNSGFEVAVEFEMEVRLDGFRKSYFADLLVDRAVIVETKAALSLNNAHEGQVLNYLFLCGLHHGTLSNFRNESVKKRYVSTTLSTSERQRAVLTDSQWRPLTGKCEKLRETIQRMIADWGACLHPSLYRECLTHALGGEADVARSIPIEVAGERVGTEEMRVLSPDVAFAVTAMVHRTARCREHLLRLLRHTRLRAIQWINFNHKTVELCTIESP
ncbi:MAG: GxxExxY protein [Gemmataceae bacterium]|nr:GxxExxY protein [Gemmataceae bacterium]